MQDGSPNLQVLYVVQGQNLFPSIIIFPTYSFLSFHLFLIFCISAVFFFGLSLYWARLMSFLLIELHFGNVEKKFKLNTQIIPDWYNGRDVLWGNCGHHPFEYYYPVVRRRTGEWKMVLCHTIFFPYNITICSSGRASKTDWPSASVTTIYFVCVTGEMLFVFSKPKFVNTPDLRRLLTLCDPRPLVGNTKYHALLQSSGSNSKLLPIYLYGPFPKKVTVPFRNIMCCYLHLIGQLDHLWRPQRLFSRHTTGLN